LPDVVALTRSYLVTVDEVNTLVGTRVSTRLPNQPTLPAVTLQRVGGVPTVWQWLDRAAIDVNVWAADEASAWTVARTVRAALLVMAGPFDEGVVTAVEDLSGLQWLPDTLVTPPVDRVHFSVAVSAHP
jgi:hypothetical protein